MGSRILSRSFHVEPWQGISETGAVTSDDDDGGLEDEPASTETTEGSNTEDSTEVAMIPMADMLNARFGNENVSRLGNRQLLKRTE
jgi:SET domain-containing protein 6